MSTTRLRILYRIQHMAFIVRFCNCGKLIVSNSDVTTVLTIAYGVLLAASFELKSESLTAMARYTQDQNYRNGRSRRSGQQHAHGRGDGYNTQHGQDERVALDQQIPQHRMQLNNFLQHRFRTTQGLRIDSSSTGPGHALQWTVIVYFQDNEYGRGEGATKAFATEIACQFALQALMQPGNGH